MDIFKLISDYFNSQNVSILDALIIAVLGGAIGVIFGDIIKAFFKLLSNTMRKLVSFMIRKLKSIYRIIINPYDININEYIKLQDMVDNGVKLSWIQRKRYEKAEKTLPKPIILINDPDIIKKLSTLKLNNLPYNNLTPAQIPDIVKRINKTD